MNRIMGEKLIRKLYVGNRHSQKEKRWVQETISRHKSNAYDIWKIPLQYLPGEPYNKP